MAMDSSTTSSHSKPTTPFDWLSGGLFFGKAKQGIERIDSSKDVLALLTGIQQNLDAILQPRITSTTEPPGSSNTDEEASDPSKFLAARLSRIRFLLYDERRITSQQHETPPPALTLTRKQSPSIAISATQGFTSESNHKDLMPRLLENMRTLPFESRKHVAAIFNYLLVAGLEGLDADLYKPSMILFRDYIESLFERFMEVIVRGHEQVATSTADIALHFGSMYRSCLRHPCLYYELVRSTERVTRFVFPFLDTYVHYSNFDVASDAMESMRVVFLAGGDKVPIDDASQQAMAGMAAEFLTRDYDEIWNVRYNPKLLSVQANYMTRRVALQILSAVLLTRSNYNVMIKYVDSRSNLILIMDLLRDTSPHITLDAWQVFKVFVANPNKPEDVIKILRDNKVKLCRYLETLHQEREESDTQFRDEKALIIATIEAL